MLEILTVHQRSDCTLNRRVVDPGRVHESAEQEATHQVICDLHIAAWISTATYRRCRLAIGATGNPAAESILRTVAVEQLGVAAHGAVAKDQRCSVRGICQGAKDEQKSKRSRETEPLVPVHWNLLFKVGV